MVRCGKRNHIIGLEEDNNLDKLTYINDLTASLLGLLSIRENAHTLLGVSLCLASSVLNKQTVSLCALPHKLCCVSDNKLCTCFYSFCLFEKFIFQWGQGPGEFCSKPLTPGGLAARIPGFHPSHPGSIPGQGTKISLQDCSLLSL